MRTQRLRNLLTFALSLVLVFAMGPPSFAQDPNRIPPELEKYRTERVGPLSGRQPDAEEVARMQAIAEHKRKFEAMMELRRTGQTTLTQKEIEDYLDAGGIKRGVKLDNVPVCQPQKPTDLCGRDGVWMVHLQPFVRIADVDSTIEALENKYGVQKKPELLVDYERPTGAYFVVSGANAQAIALSRDPLVRLVVGDRIVIFTIWNGEKLPKPATPESSKPVAPNPAPPAKPAKNAVPKAIKKASMQSVPYQLDRIDQRDLPLNNQYIAPNNGAGVDIYHVGGHPWNGHTEFASPIGGPTRTFNTFVYYAGTQVSGCDFAVNIISQHDTSVLALAAGRNIGVVPAANLVAYAITKDLGELPANYETIVTNALAALRSRIIANRPRGAIVFFTSGSRQISSSMNTVLDLIFDNADTYVIAAGPETPPGGSQSDYWPQRHARVMKVGTSDANDYECSIENNSACGAAHSLPGPIQMFAPADDVNTATIGPCAGGQPIFSDYGIHYGTSFAAPIVAGAASLFLAANSTYYPHWYQVQEGLIAMASKNKLHLRPNPSGIANTLTYNFRRSLPVSVNAASYLPTAARGSIVASFGDFGVGPNHLYLKYECGPFCGSTVEQYTFQPSGASQVNWALADNTPVGTHQVTATYTTPPLPEGLLGIGILKVVDVKPGFFTTNSLGFGTVSGWIYKYNKVTGAFEGQMQLTPNGQGTLWNSATQNAVLSLYGTGWRNGGSPTLMVNGINVGVDWSGASPCCIGLDQVNSNFLPTSLNTAGTKTILLTSQGVNSQPNVTVTFSP